MPSYNTYLYDPLPLVTLPQNDEVNSQMNKEVNGEANGENVVSGLTTGSQTLNKNSPDKQSAVQDLLINKHTYSPENKNSPDNNQLFRRHRSSSRLTTQAQKILKERDNCSQLVFSVLLYCNSWHISIGFQYCRVLPITAVHWVDSYDTLNPI